MADLVVMAELVRIQDQESALNQEKNGNINESFDHEDTEFAN